MSARDHIIDARGERVEVGDRIAAAVNSWDGPDLVVGSVVKFTEKRTSVRAEVHTDRFGAPEVSVIDDSRKRFVKLPKVTA